MITLKIQLFGGRGAWSSLNTVSKTNHELSDSIDSVVIKTKKYEIVDNKIVNFALKDGAKHSQDFFDAGYTKDNPEQLKKDIGALYENGKKQNIKYNTDSEVIKFEIVGELGKNKLRFLTGWQIDKGDNKARFITGHRI